MRNFLNDPLNMRDAEGFWLGAISGSATTIAAGGDVFSFVNLLARPVCVVAMPIRWVTTTAFSAAQSLAFRVNKVTGFSAQNNANGTLVQAHYLYAGGSNLNNAGAAILTTDRVPTTEMSGYIVATNTAISGGTYTAYDADEPDHLAVSASATSPVLSDDGVLPGPLPLVLGQNEGIVVTNLITMGSTGVGRLFVGVRGWRKN